MVVPYGLWVPTGDGGDFHGGGDDDWPETGSQLTWRVPTNGDGEIKMATTAATMRGGWGSIASGLALVMGWRGPIMDVWYLAFGSSRVMGGALPWVSVSTSPVSVGFSPEKGL